MCACERESLLLDGVVLAQLSYARASQQLLSALLAILHHKFVKSEREALRWRVHASNGPDNGRNVETH
eukprot:6194547-Pleurochrysis_carterae.AAC.3